MLFTIERIYNSEMIPKHMTCSLENPWRCSGALCSNHTHTNYAPISLSASIRFRLPLWAGWILGEVNEKQSLRVPIFSEITRVPFESFALSFRLVFSSHRPNSFWKDQTN